MTVLADIVSRNRAGERVGIASWCTAHPETLAAILSTYRADAAPILIEATCNQVNQFGGYTGMTPAAFRRFAEGVAVAQGIDPLRIILGGDHLGPNPWRHEPAAQAMDKARAMVAAYAAAGFSKLHLDASMACADDAALGEAEMAARAADLCAVAEAAGGAQYVIGTEVPVPGGETEVLGGLAVTLPEAVARTWALHAEAFSARGLGEALNLVIGLVVQPGVDFGNTQVFAFDPGRATALSAGLHNLPGPAFEAHSTDYQTGAALAALVAGHFAILKVGPELTFAFRQAAFALDDLARAIGQPAPLRAALTAAMLARPGDWRGHVGTGPREETEMLFGLSDRVRYYWPAPAVQDALARLFAGLRRETPEPGLVAQVTGGLVEPGDPATLPERVIARMVGQVVRKYRDATGG